MAEPIAPAASSATADQRLFRVNLLKWLYVGRLALVTGILAAAVLQWFQARQEDTLVAVVMFVLAFAVTAASFWHTHVVGREPSENFLYAQVLLDVALVTGVVHVTGGPESSFAPIYIMVISAGALLLPLPGGVLIGLLASLVYFADLAWGHQGSFTVDVGMRIGLFTVVALITGVLGDRLRRAGQALGAVASELRQLRLDTGDILANLSTGVLTVDGDGRLVYVNPAAEQLLGLELRGHMGEPVLDLVGRTAPSLRRVLEAAIGGRAVKRASAEVLHRRRPTRLGLSTAVLERGVGERPSATALFQDITDFERLDELNRRADRLEAVAALSASLAHEIKNPLASVRSAVEQLAKDRLSKDDRGVLERLVLNESDRLSRLLSEFLDYSGLRMSARDEVDLTDVVRECLVAVRQHPDVQGVEVEARIDEGPIPVVGDADLLHRAVFNLVLNGAQSAGAEGRVVVTLKDERNRPRPRGTDIEYPARLVVADSGPGIAPEARERIFDPFFTTKDEGSGLGLAVVHRAVEAHSGVTFVERSPEGGAQFVIFLPAERAPARSRKAGALQ